MNSYSFYPGSMFRGDNLAEVILWKDGKKALLACIQTFCYFFETRVDDRQTLLNPLGCDQFE